jgi:TPR repeat protein
MYATGQGVAQDHAEAVKWFRQAADQGNADAQFNLGVMYATGQGIAQDRAEAVKWFRQAANQGNTAVQFNLGKMYATGQGVAQDPAEAVKWFRQAADQGNAAAQFNLGAMYAKGEGVASDRVAAYAFFNLSATNDPSKDNPAIRQRAILVNRMSADELKAGQRLSREMAEPGNFLKALDAYLENPKPGRRRG